MTGVQTCALPIYSASPWYKQICKTVSLCPSARPVSNPSKLSLVSPNPSGVTFNFTAGQNIKSAKVFDQLGIEKINLGVLQTHQSVPFGEQLSSGIYFLTIQYEDKTNEVIKLIKVK